MPRIVPLKYTGSRADEYETAKIFYAKDRASLRGAIEDLNRREKRARKDAERRAKKREEKEAAEAAAAAAAVAAKIAAEIAASEAKRKARQQRQNEKRKQQRAAKRTAVSWEQLMAWVENHIGNKDLPFRLRLKSSIANVIRYFNFKSYQHFENWYAAVERQSVNQDSANYTKITELLGDEDVFNFVLPELVAVSAGCNYHNKEKLTKETAFYTFELFNPKGHHNNCGFKVLEHICGVELNYADLRKAFDLKYNEPVPAATLYKIYKTLPNSSRMMAFIDESFNDEINKDYNYIYIADNHYYYVESATYKAFKDKHTKRGFVYWDIETRPTSEYVMVGKTKSYLLKDAILCAYYCPYKSDEYSQITFTTNSDKSSCRQFLDWLSAESAAGRFYHCIAHNGSRFDLYFLLSYLTQQEQLHTETQLRGYSIIGMQFKSHLFKDSCCFLTASLDSLCKAFKVKQSKITEFNYGGKVLTNKNICFYKPELSFDAFMQLETTEPEFWKMYVEYCMFDCIGLKNVWSSFREQLSGLTDIIFKYKPELKAKVDLMGTNTIGSLSKKILENSCLVKDGKKYVKSDAYRRYVDFSSDWFDVADKDGAKKKLLPCRKKIDFINKFKRGGISHSNQPGKHTHSLISFDIASQYPASMIYMLIPCGKSKWVDFYNPYNHGFYHLKNLVFDSKYSFKPIASKDEKDVLVWNNEKIDEIYLDSFLIKYMQEHYGLKSFDVVKGLVSQSYIKGEQIFGEYVNTLYNEKKQQDKYKTENDERYNPALRECIKLFLNSLSGKLVEDPSRYFKLVYGGDASVKLNGIDAEKIEDDDKFNIWVNAGVMVYSYSKRLLFEYVRCLPNNSDDVIHIETDSIYFNKKHQQTFMQNISAYKQPNIGHYPIAVGADLGNVKVEKDTNEVSYFLGKKFYCIGDLYKIKGIPLKTIDEYGNDVELVNTSLYESIYNGEKVVKEFYTMKKSLFSEKTYISSHKMKRTISPAMEYKLYTE